MVDRLNPANQESPSTVVLSLILFASFSARPGVPCAQSRAPSSNPEFFELASFRNLSMKTRLDKIFDAN